MVDTPILPAVAVEYRHIHISEDPEGFKAKIKVAYALKQYAAELLTGGGQ